MDGNEYTVLNPTRDDKTKGSFRINVSSGAWADFAVDGMRGQSPVSLYQHLHRVSREEAIEEIGRQLGMIDGSGIKPDFSGLLASVKGGAGQDAAATDENECVMPVPEEAGDAPIQRGETGRWPYLNRDGKLLGYVLRFDPPGKRKWYSPLTFWKNGGWKMKHWPSPKPLYGLDLLAERPDDRTGEKQRQEDRYQQRQQRHEGDGGAGCPHPLRNVDRIAGYQQGIAI